MRHCSINPCEKLGSCQKFITNEIFPFKLLEPTILVFSAESKLFYRKYLVVLVLVSLSALTILQ